MNVTKQKCVLIGFNEDLQNFNLVIILFSSGNETSTLTLNLFIIFLLSWHLKIRIQNSDKTVNHTLVFIKEKFQINLIQWNKWNTRSQWSLMSVYVSGFYSSTTLNGLYFLQDYFLKFVARVLSILLVLLHCNFCEDS